MASIGKNKTIISIKNIGLPSKPKPKMQQKTKKKKNRASTQIPLG